MLQVDLTFHFKVSDSCDNETLCDVTVGGACQPFCTYTMGAWGNPTGIRFNGLTTT